MANNSCYITTRTRKTIVFLCMPKSSDIFSVLFM